MRDLGVELFHLDLEFIGLGSSFLSRGRLSDFAPRAFYPSKRNFASLYQDTRRTYATKLHRAL